MTPRQIAAFAFLASRRRERDLAQLLGVMSLASSQDVDAIKKQMDKWEGDQ